MTFQYDLMTFPAVYDPAPADDVSQNATQKAPSTRNARRVAAKTLEIDSQNITRVESVNDLAAMGLPPLALQVACHGNDPATLNAECKAAGIETDFKDRSDPLLYFVCECVRQGVPDQTIYSIITDRKFGVSASVVDRRDYDRYAKKQIVKAHAEVTVADAAARTGVHFPDGCNPDGLPFAKYGNVKAAIDGLRIKCSFDLFRDKTLVETQSVNEQADNFADHVVTLIQNWIYAAHKFYPSEEHVRNIIVVRAREAAFDPVLDSINGLVWDKTPRLDKWLTTNMGATSTDYVDAVGRKVLIGLVRRVRSPGCKVDSILVLENEAQEIGKSLLCADLAGKPDLFTDQDIFTLDNKAQQELLAGKLIVELAELSGLRRADLEKTKSFVTRTHDRGRPAYGRISIDQPRRCTMIGSTNEDTYLNDPSGNRRWWPVKVTGYNREAFLRDRDQLLAEAAHYEAEGESLYLPPSIKVAARAEQQARMVHDGWTDLLADVMGGPHNGGQEERVASKWLLGNVLELPAEKHTDQNLKRLLRAMRSLGWDGPHPMRIDGNDATVRGYKRAARPGASAAWAIQKAREAGK